MAHSVSPIVAIPQGRVMQMRSSLNNSRSFFFLQQNGTLVERFSSKSIFFPGEKRRCDVWLSFMNQRKKTKADCQFAQQKSIH